MGKISRRSFLKISGATAASTALVPFGAKWVEAFLKDFSDMPLDKDMTDDQFIKYIEDVLKKHEDVVGVSANVEIVDSQFPYAVDNYDESAKLIRGLLAKGDKGKYWSFMYYDEVKSDLALRKAFTKDMLHALSSAWKGKHPTTPIDINYVV